MLSKPQTEGDSWRLCVIDCYLRIQVWRRGDERIGMVSTISFIGVFYEGVLPFLSSEPFSLLEEKYRRISFGLTPHTLWINLGIEWSPACKCADISLSAASLNVVESAQWLGE